MFDWRVFYLGPIWLYCSQSDIDNTHKHTVKERQTCAGQSVETTKVRGAFWKTGWPGKKVLESGDNFT